jgi:hypothetical protein
MIRVFVCFLALAAFAWAAPISTGVAPWEVNGNPVVIENPIAIPYWISNFGDGSWVGTTADDGSLSGGALPGTYTFTLAIGSLIGAPGTFSLQYAADNNIRWTITNGALGGTTNCAATDCFSSAGGAPRSLSGSFDISSILTATVVNEGTALNPMGLIVVGTADESGIPEPSTVVLCLSGLAAAFVLRRR